MLILLREYARSQCFKRLLFFFIESMSIKGIKVADRRKINIYFENICYFLTKIVRGFELYFHFSAKIF